MGDFLRSVTSGIARFVSAWMLPCAVAVGLFWAVCVPALVSDRMLGVLTGTHVVVPTSGPIEVVRRSFPPAVALAIATTLAASTVLAYGSQVIYRLLEGYHLPRHVGQWMRNRQVSTRRRLAAVVAKGTTTPNVRRSIAYGLAVERLGQFPNDEARVLPTRLGNALRAMETYGEDVFRLDSQQLWYELLGTARPAVRQEQAEARALVDLFVAAIAAGTILSVVAVAVAIATESVAPAVLAASAGAFCLVAYRGAVRNMKEWQNSVRALVNLGRPDLAEGLSMSLPKRLEDERLMWDAVCNAYAYRQEGWVPWLDVFRRTAEPRRPQHP